MGYSCHFCKHIFTAKGSLDRHIETNHMDINYRCAICEKSYKRKSDLSAHIAERHSNFMVWKTMRTGYLQYMKTITLLDESGILLEGPNPRYFGTSSVQIRKPVTMRTQTLSGHYPANATATLPDSLPTAAVATKKARVQPPEVTLNCPAPLEEYHTRETTNGKVQTHPQNIDINKMPPTTCKPTRPHNPGIKPKTGKINMSDIDKFISKITGRFSHPKEAQF